MAFYEDDKEILVDEGPHMLACASITPPTRASECEHRRRVRHVVFKDDETPLAKDRKTESGPMIPRDHTHHYLSSKQSTWQRNPSSLNQQGRRKGKKSSQNTRLGHRVNLASPRVMLSPDGRRRRRSSSTEEIVESSMRWIRRNVLEEDNAATVKELIELKESLQSLNVSNSLTILEMERPELKQANDSSHINSSCGKEECAIITKSTCMRNKV